MSAPTPVRIALFGAGRIGHVHANNISALPDAELVVIADPFIDGARALATATGSVAVASPEEVFAREDIDAVVIGSPTNTHVDLITRAAGRGLAVLCEKPIDLDIASVRACQEKLGDRASQVMLGFNRRFDPSFASVQRRVAAGEVGKLEQLIIISRDPEPAPRGYLETSGGIFRDMSIHDLDMARFFVPDIVEVTATGSNTFSSDIRELGDYDTATITLRGANGELITIINSRHCAFGYDQRIEAFGSGGMLSAGNRGETTVQKFDAAGTGQADVHLPFFLERYAQAYLEELKAFVAGIRNGTGFSPGFHDGVAALELADAAITSADTGTTQNTEKARV
ncbi:inositol 2-dehydrogenase [Corynebacterium pacaense]|uniref:inositol 2-dehydrogenase n=1 Tax=Corynebacterium pacaense TaxID=1816684 RepID=UPI0009BC3109|nr:inositol 2-dehydrogenase [Corynebacterium pacaense]